MQLSAFRRRFKPRTVKVAGMSWQVIETKPKSASAPVLLMLPGTLGTAEIFWNQMHALGDSVRCVSVTYPITDDIARLADGLAALCDKLGIAKASLVGSSLGGYLVQFYAARHPQRVTTAFIGNSLSNPALSTLTRQTYAELEKLPATAHRDFILASVKTWKAPEPIFAQLKRLLIESGSKKLSPAALKARVLIIKKGGEVPKLDLPGKQIVVIDSADDPLLDRRVQDDVVARYPGATHVRLKIGGHYPYVTRPDRYTAILAKALGVKLQKK
ncbi:MAG: alpha/beta fold hydrolase [Alphaproteobacteria bacterium]